MSSLWHVDSFKEHHKQHREVLMKVLKSREVLMKVLKSVVAIASIVLSSSVSAATFSYNSNSEIVGLNNVSLGGHSEVDVSFVDGTCASVYNGCTGITLPQYYFYGYIEDALDDLMLNNGVTFEDFAGYQAGLPMGNGFILWNLNGGTMEGISVSGVSAYDRASYFGTSTTFDFDDNQDSIFQSTQGVFMVVSEVTAVPVPAAAWLFGSALLGLGAVKRRKA